MAKLVTDDEGALYAHGHPPRIWDTFNEYTTQQTNGVIKKGIKGRTFYITDIFIQVNAAVNVTIFDGATATKLKFIGVNQGDGITRSYKVPKKCQPGNDITITTSGAVTVEVEIHGFTKG